MATPKKSKPQKPSSDATPSAGKIEIGKAQHVGAPQETEFYPPADKYEVHIDRGLDAPPEEIEDVAVKAREEAKAAAETDYGKRLAAVLEIKAMTDSPVWRRFYASCQRTKDQAARRILTAEKPRDMIVCQEEIKAVEKLFAGVIEPIQDLNTFCNSMPLFASSFKTRAAWNKEVGIVELSGLN